MVEGSSRQRVRRQGRLNKSEGSNISCDALPTELINHIFTFLPVKDSARMVAVSKAFRKTWLYCQNLDFGLNFIWDRERIDVCNIISNVSVVHEGRIKIFRLYFDPTGLEHAVENWLQKFISKGVEELELDFVNAAALYRFSSMFLNVESIRTLKISTCEILDFPPKFKGLTLLRSLVLNRTKISEAFFKTLLLNCKILQCLDICECFDIQNLWISASHLRKFRTLTIRDCYDIAHVKIDAPALRSLFYIGSSRINFIFENVLQLTHVSLVIKNQGYGACTSMKTILSGLSHVKVFTTTGAFLEGLIPRVKDKELMEMKLCFWNLKELQLLMQGANFLNVYDMISFLKRCLVLEKLFIDFSGHSFEDTVFWQVHHKEKQSGFHHNFHRLKFVKLCGFKSNSHEMDMAKILLERTPVLEKLVILLSSNKYRKRGDMLSISQIYSELSGCVKASPEVKIIISKHSNEKKFDVPTHNL